MLYMVNPGLQRSRHFPFVFTNVTPAHYGLHKLYTIKILSVCHPLLAKSGFNNHSSLIIYAPGGSLKR